ncbi:uncharacterized protein LOC127525935 [Erpetoichthys calabaricus]|uniref:uncharacterized protein LOC127525935 n=1 Tax=Erpetoichthys calabaricus TaxID=27687 RepID=UPI002233ED63|nr:uncharacterized protein LOC127525935 [Erpetoichthys calabaricus]
MAANLERLSRCHGIKFISEEFVPLEAGVLAVGEVIGCENIKSASRMSGSIVAFLSSEDLVPIMVEKGVVINGSFVQVSPLAVPSRRVTISNAPPFLKNETIAKELERHGRLVSKIRYIPLGCKSPDLKHVLSFRRQVYMVLNRMDGDLNVAMKFRVDGFDYVIFVTLNEMKCFGCGSEAHLIKQCPERQHGHKKTDHAVTEKEGQEVKDRPVVADGAEALVEARGVKNRNASRSEGLEDQVPPRDEPNEGGSETVGQTTAAAESVWGDIDMDEGGSNEPEEKSEFKRPAQKKQGEREERARKKLVLSQGSGVIGEDPAYGPCQEDVPVFAETADDGSIARNVGEETDDGNISNGSAASEPPELKARGGYSAQSVKDFLVNTAGKKGVDVAEFFPDIELFISSVRGLRRDKAASAMFDVKELVRLKNLTSKLRKQSNLNTP